MIFTATWFLKFLHFSNSSILLICREMWKTLKWTVRQLFPILRINFCIYLSAVQKLINFSRLVSEEASHSDCEGFLHYDIIIF